MAALFTVENHHHANCGTPPSVRNDTPNVYRGYFEGPDGDQWLFEYDRTTKHATLRGGDIQWDKVDVVEDGWPVETMLNKAESFWLRACWLAVAE